MISSFLLLFLTVTSKVVIPALGGGVGPTILKLVLVIPSVSVKSLLRINISPLISVITVPSDSTLVLVSRDTAIYIPHDTKIEALASAASDCQLTYSYDEIT